MPKVYRLDGTVVKINLGETYKIGNRGAEFVKRVQSEQSFHGKNGFCLGTLHNS
jgi:hypothetical protein